MRKRIFCEVEATLADATRKRLVLIQLISTGTLYLFIEFASERSKSKKHASLKGKYVEERQGRNAAAGERVPRERPRDGREGGPLGQLPRRRDRRDRRPGRQRAAGAALAGASGDPVAQEIENTKAQQEELLKKPGGSTLLEEDAAAMEEDVAAFLADTEQRHKDDKEHKKDDKVASELGRNSGAHVDHAPKALALEATTETQQQLPSAITLSSQQESTVPHMIFGGAFLLVAAVLLTAMTKRARAPAKPHASKDDAYAYYLHQ
ncbi:hypothetical protein FI667_g15748, partial [Globisporangium splendens]